ncbi:hypothetical protein Agub_g10507, partial [Astrephomene gubernaculifera]
MAEVEDEVSDDEDNAVALDYEFERNATTNEIEAFHIQNSFVNADHPSVVRRYSTVMVQADPGTPKFVGYIRNVRHQRPCTATRQFVETEDDVLAELCWFYRTHDVRDAGVALPKDTLVRRARLSGVKGGGDRGTFKELFFSNHKDTVSLVSIMHTVKVWCLPDDDLSPVLITPPPPSQQQQQDLPPATSTSTASADAAAAADAPTAAAATAAAARGTTTALLPGFVCRRFYHVQQKKMTPLGRVAAAAGGGGGGGGGGGVERWLAED